MYRVTHIYNTNIQNSGKHVQLSLQCKRYYQSDIIIGINMKNESKRIEPVTKLPFNTKKKVSREVIKLSFTQIHTF